MLATFLDRHAVERPHATALVTPTAIITWRELQHDVDRLAAGMRQRGVVSGEALALVATNSPAFVTAFLAAARLGAVATPLSVDFTHGQLRQIIADTGCTSVVCDDRFSPLGRTLLEEAVVRRVFISGADAPDMPSLARVAAEAMPHGRLPHPDADAPLLQQFTSGSTGEPACILRTHAALMRMTTAFGAAAGMSPEDRVLALIPFCHGHGLNNALLTALNAGATIVLEEHFDRRLALELLARHRITVFPTVPFIAGILAATRTAEAVDLSALRMCICGGSPLSPDTWIAMRDRLGIALRNSYGSTETGAVTLDTDATPSPGSGGRLLDGVELQTRDEHGVALPPGEKGELSIRSPWAAVARVTARGREPVASSDGWVRMKDVGRVTGDRRLELSGNNGLLINVAGRKVNPLDVEHALLAHPQIRDAAVFPLHDTYGEQGVQAAVVVNGPCTAEELLVHCRLRLAPYQVPRIIRFDHELPRSAAGKLLRLSVARAGAQG
jgi:long-chain acyl-CoA synthetase